MFYAEFCYNHATILNPDDIPNTDYLLACRDNDTTTTYLFAYRHKQDRNNAVTNNPDSIQALTYAVARRRYGIATLHNAAKN